MGSGIGLREWKENAGFGDPADDQERQVHRRKILELRRQRLQRRHSTETASVLLIRRNVEIRPSSQRRFEAIQSFNL